MAHLIKIDLVAAYKEAAIEVICLFYSLQNVN